MHIHFDVLRGVPIEATLTAGSSSEKAQLRATVQPGRLHVIDRGYAEYQLFQDVMNAGSGFIGWIRAPAATRAGSQPNPYKIYLQLVKVPSTMKD
jgi:hypothetical protein